jgi:hypothetical protein
MDVLHENIMNKAQSVIFPQESTSHPAFQEKWFDDGVNAATLLEAHWLSL